MSDAIEVIYDGDYVAELLEAIEEHEQTIAEQKRVIEKLREQRNIENGAKWNARGLGTVSGISEIEKMDAQIAAIEQGDGT